MVPTDFLAAFVDFLRVDIVIFCHTEVVQQNNLPDAHIMLGYIDGQRLHELQPSEDDTLTVCPMEEISTLELSLENVGKGHNFLFLEDENNSHHSSFSTLRLDSRVYLARDYSESLKVHEVYRIKRGPLIRREIFSWNLRNHSVEKINRVHIWERRSDLMGVNLVDPWLSWRPFVYMNDQGELDGKEKRELMACTVI